MKLKVYILFIITVLGCTAALDARRYYDYDDGYYDGRGTARGAVAGGIAGATLGGIFGGPRGAAIGAGVGVTAGAAAGSRERRYGRGYEPADDYYENEEYNDYE